MDACSALPTGTRFISSMTSYMDCQSQVLGSGGWSALAAPGSTLTVVLTGFLTITIALIGYNLLLGRAFSVREGTLAFVKIGAIFALATSWPAYRTLVYDLVTDGPAQLVAEIGPHAGVVGSDGSLTQRLDLADQAMAQLAILGPGIPQANADTHIPPPPFGGFDAFALGGSRILFELTAVGGLGIVRIITGLMLALGPFFIAFLMFESTRSLFEGWVRVLGGAALAAIGVTIALGLELALLGPWLSNVLARRMAGEALPAVASELFVIATLFAILLAAVLLACARVARAFRLAQLIPTFAASMRQHKAAASPEARFKDCAAQHSRPAEPSRAAEIATVMAAMDRRMRGAPWIAPTAPRVRARTGTVVGSTDSAPAPSAVGRTFTRRIARRISTVATKRDSRA